MSKKTSEVEEIINNFFTVDGKEHHISELIDQVLDWHTRQMEIEKAELISKVKIHFELMVFDDTGEDKLENIMEFRRKQRDYLVALKSEEKEEVGG